MKRPLFSCVIPVKGARPYFEEALESLLSQGMGDDGWWLVDREIGRMKRGVV